MRQRLFFAIGFLFLILPTNAFAATYYVDSVGGSNSNDGLTTGTAWQTVTPLNSQTFVAGDTVYFKRGETFSNAKITLFDDSGSAGNPITFDAYGTGADPILDAGSQNRVFDIRNSASYITIQNLKLQNPSETGIFIFSGTFTGLNFNHLTVTGTTTQAVLLSTNATSTSSTYDNVTIYGFTTGFGFSSARSQGDTFSNLSITASTTGITLGGSSAPVSDLTIENSTVKGEAGSCIQINNVTTASIDSVTASGCGANGIFILNTTSGVSVTNSTLTGNGARGLRFDNRVVNGVVATSTISSNTNEGILMLGGALGTAFSNLTVGSNGTEGLDVTMGGSSDTLSVASSTFNNNGTVSESNGVAVNGTAGTVTISYTTADSNTNDGFGFHNGPTANIDHATSTNNGVDGIGADGDGFSWHDTSLGTLTNSYAWNNKKSAITNITTSSVTVYNSVFGYTTTAGTNALVTLTDSAAISFYNNTLVNPSQAGTAIDLQSDGTVTVKNNLIYGFATGISKTVGASAVTEDYNVVANTGTAAVSGSGFALGSNSTTTDPQLADASGGNYRLTAASVAVNAGTDSLCPSTDRDGVTRQGVCDIGAYEYQWISPTSAFTSSASGLTATFTDASTDSDGSVASWSWDFGDSNTSTSQNPSHTYASAGSYTVSLTVTDNHGATDDSSSPVTVSAPASSGGGGGGGSSPPKPKVPENGWQIYATSTASSTVSLSFNYNDDIKYLWISEWYNGNPATQVNATSTIEWPQPKLGVLYIKFCNRFHQCTDFIPKVVVARQATPVSASGFTFLRNLAYRMTGRDVQELQKYLNTHGFTLAQNGEGSPGSETNYFGLLTYSALVKFQEANAATILTPIGLTKGSGYFGPSTRAFINGN